MTVAINWSVDSMITKPHEGNYDDVVITVNWRCSASEGVHYAPAYGSCNLPAPDQTFVEYGNLTLEHVLGLIWANGVNKTAIEAQVTQAVNDLVNPPTVVLPLPW